MKIHYNLNKDDYINFNVYHSKNSNSIQKNLNMQRFIIPLIFFIFPFIAKINTGISLWYWLAIFSVIYVLWTIFYPKYYHFTAKKGVRKIFEEGKNQNLVGPKMLELDEDGIFSSSKDSQSKIKWPSVEKYVETSDYIFIYISSIEAYIVPKRTFDNEGEIEKFTSILGNRIN